MELVRYIKKETKWTGDGGREIMGEMNKEDSILDKMEYNEKSVKINSERREWDRVRKKLKE